jgi:hypothetical protein
MKTEEQSSRTGVHFPRVAPQVVLRTAQNRPDTRNQSHNKQCHYAHRECITGCATRDKSCPRDHPCACTSRQIPSDRLTTINQATITGFILTRADNEGVSAGSNTGRQRIEYLLETARHTVRLLFKQLFWLTCSSIVESLVMTAACISRRLRLGTEVNTFAPPAEIATS